MDRFVTRTPRKRSRSGKVITRAARKTSISRGLVETRTHHFIRACATSSANRYGLNTDSAIGFVYNGANTGVFNMQFAFTLAGVQVYFGGTLSHTITLPNYPEFTALYDQYRIDWVECEFYFSNNQSSVNSPATTLPLIYVAKDYDDANQAFIADLQQYENTQTWQLGNDRGDGKRTVNVKPNVDVAVYNTALTSGYARGKPMFIDVGSPNVPHYGIKIAYDPINYPTNTLVGYLSVVFKYHMSMTHTK